ncbi:MAG: pyrroline-5-carboxylate reductase [Victivallales bacterium]|nr:pyrroline-5-carboxylate reductase [Victivallales bacterium]
MKKLLFIGAGKMATAIAGGLVKAKVFAPAELQAYDVNSTAAADFTRATGIPCATENCAALIEDSERVLLAIKPQVMVKALTELSGKLADKTIISIIAGATLNRLAELTGSSKVIRVMPNTPALIGKGAAGIAALPGVDDAEFALSEKIFAAVGVVIRVEEHNLNAVTALSGSGPAYVFEFIQALADGGVASGLSRATATELAVQTVIGAAEMVKLTKLHPSALKDQVTSPGGTTIRALEVLEDRAFAGTVIQAVCAACRRSEELGKN